MFFGKSPMVVLTIKNGLPQINGKGVDHRNVTFLSFVCHGSGVKTGRDGKSYLSY